MCAAKTFQKFETGLVTDLLNRLKTAAFSWPVSAIVSSDRRRYRHGDLLSSLLVLIVVILRRWSSRSQRRHFTYCDCVSLPVELNSVRPIVRFVIELWSFAVSTVRYCVALVLVFICRMLNGSATSALQMTFNLLLLVWLIYCDVSRELEACWPRTLNPTMPYHTIVGCAAQWYWTGRTSVSDRRTFPSCARPAADGWPLVVKQLYVSQPG